MSIKYSLWLHHILFSHLMHSTIFGAQFTEHKICNFTVSPCILIH